MEGICRAAGKVGKREEGKKKEEVKKNNKDKREQAWLLTGRTPCVDAQRIPIHASSFRQFGIKSMWHLLTTQTSYILQKYS